MRTSYLTTIKAILKTISNPKEAHELAVRSGQFFSALSEEMANGVSKYSLMGRLSNKFMKGIQFNLSDHWNRMYSAVAGKMHINNMTTRLLKKNSDAYARRELLKLKINPDDVLKKGFVDEETMLDGVYEIARDTQFTNNVNDLPAMHANNPWFKMMFQFKSFAYKQGAFLKKHVYNEAKAGNYRPLLGMALSTMTFGELVGTTRAYAVDSIAALFGKDDWKYTTRRSEMTFGEREMDNFFMSGGLGIVYDTLRQTEYGKEFFTESILGPSAGTALDVGVPIASGLFKSSKLDLEGAAKDAQTAVSEGFGQAPFAGKHLRDIFKPEKSKGQSGWSKGQSGW
jgi:hypothetical protein